MRWTLLAVLFAAVAATVSGQGLKMSVGLDAGFIPGVQERQTLADPSGIYLPAGTQFSEDYSYGAGRIGAFVDLTYAVLSAAYRTSVTPLTGSITAFGQTASGQAALSLSFLEARAMAKVPFRLPGLTALILAGAEYTACLSGSIGGMALDDQSKQDVSDTSLIGGFGLDFAAGETWFLRSCVMGGYSLTSRRSAPYYDGFAYVSSSRWRIELDLDAGWLIIGRNAAERH